MSARWRCKASIIEPVMAGLVPAIHALTGAKDVDARAKPAHDVKKGYVPR
jgi:hypothetical protein